MTREEQRLNHLIQLADEILHMPTIDPRRKPILSKKVTISDKVRLRETVTVLAEGGPSSPGLDLSCALSEVLRISEDGAYALMGDEHVLITDAGIRTLLDTFVPPVEGPPLTRSVLERVHTAIKGRYALEADDGNGEALAFMDRSPMLSLSSVTGPVTVSLSDYIRPIQRGGYHLRGRIRVKDTVAVSVGFQPLISRGVTERARISERGRYDYGEMDEGTRVADRVPVLVKK